MIVLDFKISSTYFAFCAIGVHSLVLITTALTTHNRVAALIDGRIKIDGYEICNNAISASHIPNACFDRKEFDLAELSPIHLIRAIERGEQNYVGLPLMLSAGFRHGSIYVSKNGRIFKPKDLQGARVGVSDFFGTSVLWARAFLQEECGVDLTSIKWMLGSTEANSVLRSLPEQIFKPYEISSIPDGLHMDAMLLSGEVDAIISPRPPRYYIEGYAIRRLLMNHQQHETDYYRNTNIFPVLHIPIVRHRLIKNDVSLYHALGRAITQAKNRHCDELMQLALYKPDFPWMYETLEKLGETMGRDPWPYSEKSAVATFQAFTRHCYDQGITKRLISTEELFPYGFFQS